MTLAMLKSDSSGGVGGPVALHDRFEIVLFVAPKPCNLVAVQQVCNNIGKEMIGVSITAVQSLYIQ